MLEINLLSRLLQGIKKRLVMYRKRFVRKSDVFDKKRLNHLQNAILKYYETVSQEQMCQELSDAINYLKSKPITYFPCELSRKYWPDMVTLKLDEDTKLHYALIDGKKMYFRRGWSERDCINYCYCIQEEQDDNSPHRYLSQSFNVETGDVVVDIGAAEGIFALEIIERVSKVYLFETDSSWIEALTATFAPWKEKVEIVNKFISDEVGGDNITLDRFFINKQRPDFIKIDVDGNEAKVMKGSAQLLAGKNAMKIAICTYHKQEDESIFAELLSDNGFCISFSKGYFIFINDELSPPYFRRGILQASRFDHSYSTVEQIVQNDQLLT